jgi:hypothetical protein
MIDNTTRNTSSKTTVDRAAITHNIISHDITPHTVDLTLAATTDRREEKTDPV